MMKSFYVSFGFTANMSKITDLTIESDGCVPGSNSYTYHSYEPDYSGDICELPTTRMNLITLRVFDERVWNSASVHKVETLGVGEWAFRSGVDPLPEKTLIEQCPTLLPNLKHLEATEVGDKQCAEIARWLPDLECFLVPWGSMTREGVLLMIRTLRSLKYLYVCSNDWKESNFERDVQKYAGPNSFFVFSQSYHNLRRTLYFEYIADRKYPETLKWRNAVREYPESLKWK